MNTEEIAKLEIPSIDSPSKLESNFISVSGKQGILVNRKSASALTIENGRIVISFNEPTWVYDLTLWLTEEDETAAENLKNHTKIQLKYSKGKTTTLPFDSFKSIVDCYVKDFIDEIQIIFHGIKNPTPSNDAPTCRKIDIRGFAPKDFKEFCSNVGFFVKSSEDFHKAKEAIIADLARKEAIFAEKNEELNEIKNNIKILKSNEADLTDSEKSLQTEIGIANTKLEIISAKTAELEERSTSQTQANNNLLKEIETNRAKRDTLLNDNNIFMEEFSSYVKQGRESIKIYISIGAACIAILFACLYRLISSSLALAADPIILKEISAIDLLLSRIPFVLVLGIVMMASLKITFQLLNGIFEIHQERLLLTKLSILAKDNSYSSADGLSIPNELIYAQKSALKMELLKEFLAGEYKNIPKKQIELKSRFQSFLSKPHTKSPPLEAANAPNAEFDPPSKTSS